MRAEIKALHQRLGTTAVYVTHDQVEAMTMSSKIVVLRAGHVEQIGTPLDLYDHPTNVFVAGFIGSPSMNLLPARIENRRQGPCATLPDESVVSLPAGAWPDGREVIIGIRPEHVEANAPADAGGVGFTARVVVVEPTGENSIITANCAGGAITIIASTRRGIRAGATLTVSAREKNLHLFDKDTGRNLTSLKKQ